MRESLTVLQEDALGVIMDRRSSNPITGKEVANIIGLKPRTTGKEGADMRSVINALRVKGYPICASGKGYFWPSSLVELNGYIESFQGRIDDQQRALAGLVEGRKKVHTFKNPVESRPLRYSAIKNGNSTVFEVAPAREEEFLKMYPDAKRV